MKAVVTEAVIIIHAVAEVTTREVEEDNGLIMIINTKEETDIHRYDALS